MTKDHKENTYKISTNFNKIDGNDILNKCTSNRNKQLPHCSKQVQNASIFSTIHKTNSLVFKQKAGLDLLKLIQKPKCWHPLFSVGNLCVSIKYKKRRFMTNFCSNQNYFG